MQTKLYLNSMSLNFSSSKQEEQTAIDPTGEKNDGEKTEKKGQNDSVVVNLSETAVKNSKQSEEAAEALPANIKQLKAQIKRLKKQIEEQEQKITELNQKKMDEELKQQLKDTYMKELSTLRASLQMATTALADAVKAQGITDPSLLTAAFA